MRVVSSRVVYENRWMRVHEDRDGAGGEYGWIEKPPAALIVPVQNGFVWLVEQFRHPVGGRFWEFPQGSAETAGEELARTELAEETGLRAGSLDFLGRLFFAYGLSNQYVDVWRASDLVAGEQDLEDTEEGLIVRRFSVADVDAMVGRNEIRDAASVAAWHLSNRRPAEDDVAPQ
jgi:8-oxo-dGTP pyrophosphatase MutT (NUDIX family)